MNEVRNEIKSYIVRRGMTMNDVVALLADEYGWSTSVSNLSDKLRRESLRYREAVELADVLDYDIEVCNTCNPTVFEKVSGACDLVSSSCNSVSY